MKFRFGTATVLALLVVVGTLVAPAAFAGDDSDLAARVATWEKAYNAGDAAGVAAHYTEDAQRMGYQAPTVSGRAAIAASIDATRERGIAQVKLTAAGGETHGTMSWGHGTYELIGADGATLQTGKWMNVSKKVGGTWLIHADMWNTDAPEE